MKHILQQYSREILSIIIIVVSLITLREFAIHKDAILPAVFSPNGIAYMGFLAAGIDLCLVIRIHYRVIIIRYSGKEIRIGLSGE